MTPEEMVASIRRRVEAYREIDENGCWLWTRCLTWAGYGRLQVTDVDGRSTAWGAHRAAYVAWVGPVPEGLHLDHLCRVRHCVNPKHLEPVTVKENLYRSPVAPASINSRRTHCKRGHEFTAANTYVPSRTNYRACRTCRNDWMVKKRAERRAAGLNTRGVTPSRRARTS